MAAILKMAPFLILILVHKFINLPFLSFINHQSIFEAEMLYDKKKKIDESCAEKKLEQQLA